MDDADYTEIEKILSMKISVPWPFKWKIYQEMCQQEEMLKPSVFLFQIHFIKEHDRKKVETNFFFFQI